MWNITRMILRENGLQRPAKGGSTPAFACQRAAIAPLPCPNLQPYCFMIQLYLNWTVLKNAIAAEKTYYKNNLLRKRGLLAHTSAAFLKNCCTEKLFSCLRLVSCNQLHIFLFPLLSLVFVKRWIISFTIPYYTTYNTVCQPTIVPNFHRSFCAECSPRKIDKFLVFSKRSSPRKTTRTLHKEFFPKKQFWPHFTIKSPSFSGKIG